MKPIIVFFAVLMGCVTIGTGDVDQNNTQDSHGGIYDEELITGGDKQGEVYPMKCGKHRDLCTGTMSCCKNQTHPLYCFKDGRCGSFKPQFVRHHEVVKGVVGEWVFYDSCESFKSKIREKCKKNSECCERLYCKGGQCSADRTLLELFGLLRGF